MFFIYSLIIRHRQEKQEGLLQNIEGMTPNRNELSERRFRIEYFPAEENSQKN